MRAALGAILSATLVLGAHTAAGQTTKAKAAKFGVTSTDIRPGATIGSKHIFSGMGCTGNNLSPALRWTGVPAGTKSFAVTIYDPDAPTGSGWWHWVVYNIPATTTSLPTGAGDVSGKHLPAGTVQGNTDFGVKAYGGPCPPVGDKPHHYIITVYALKVPTLDVPATASSAYVGFNIHANVLASARLTGLYGR